MRSWDAIVVGTGVGGSVTAAMLAHRAGWRVLVLEKNDRPGGILATFERDGFRMDAGSHLVARGEKGPLGAVLRELGLSSPRFLKAAIPVRSRGMLDVTVRQSRLGIARAALSAMRDLALPPRDVAALARMVVRVAAMRGDELERWNRRTLEDFVALYTRHPAAYFLFSFLASIFFVLPPWQVSAGASLSALRSVVRDWSLSYLEGGMSAFSRALLGVVTRRGGSIVTGARVVAIERRGGMLEVTTAAGDTHRAPFVACNLAPADLLALLPGRDVPGEWAARVRRILPSGNALQLKIALARPLVEEGCLIGGISVEGKTLGDLSHALMRDTVASLDLGRVADPLPVYVPVPTNFDPTLAPPGRQLLVASIYSSTRDTPADPPEVWRDAALRALASVIPGLLDEVLFVETAPVEKIGRWMGKSSRAAICNGHWPGQVGADRLPVATAVPGLFLCGDGAGGEGIGIEMAALSGVEAASGILARAAAKEAA